MLTVCIPVFNYDVRELLSDLLFQMQTIAGASEIIIIDDGSRDAYKTLYKELQNEKVTIILLDENIGRARIRNCFLNYARYNNLLFMDCDSKIIKSDFIKNYFKHIQKDYAVICGGRIYPSKVPSRKYRLHWKYGSFRESKTASDRNLQPNRSFMTNNFLINKNIFQRFNFSEKLITYGHEDTLMGFELQKAGIGIVHINNPVLHGKLETNKEFLAKTKSSVQNLVFILRNINEDQAFINCVSLLKGFFILKRKGADKILYFIAPAFVPFIRVLLKWGLVNLRLFDLFKLFLFCWLYKKDINAKKGLI